MLRSGIPPGNDGPTMCITKNKKGRKGVNEAYILKEGWALGLTVAMTKNAFMTNICWEEIRDKVRNISLLSAVSLVAAGGVTIIGSASAAAHGGTWRHYFWRALGDGARPCCWLRCPQRWCASSLLLTLPLAVARVLDVAGDSLLRLNLSHKFIGYCFSIH